jgi:hypothetical protein
MVMTIHQSCRRISPTRPSSLNRELKTEIRIFVMGNESQPYRLFSNLIAKAIANRHRGNIQVIPKHKMATPFCAFKTLTGRSF